MPTPSLSKPTRHFHPYAILPLLVLATSFILSILIVFAGNKPNFMEDYALFTLNTSRIGQNAIEKLDNKILSFNVTKIVHVKRDVVLLPLTTTTTQASAPTVQPRGLDDIVDALTSDISSLKTKAGGRITSVESAISSKATALASSAKSGISSIEAIAASKITSAIHAAQTAVVEAIDTTYLNAIRKSDVKDFYVVYLRSVCSGEYVTSKGENVTIGVSPSPAANGTRVKMVTGKCEKHSSLNPLVLVRILYYLGIFFTGLALLLSIFATFFFSRKLVLLILLCLLPALCFMFLASATTHGIAVGITGLTNFLGKPIGVEAYKGGKLIASTWAVTILLAVGMVLWIILAFVGEHLPMPKKRASSERDVEMEMEEREMVIGNPVYLGKSPRDTSESPMITVPIARDGLDLRVLRG